MELDSRFTIPGSLQPLASSSETARDDWVNMQLSRTFVANARTALLSAVLTIPLTVYVLYSFVSTAWLLAWTGVAVGMALYRHWIVKTYLRKYSKVSAAKLRQFFNQHRWSWPASAALWAGLMFLYLGQVPLSNQFICTLILVGMGALSGTLMSAQLNCFRSFVSALSITALCAVVASWYQAGSWSVQSFDIALAALILIFWTLLLSSGTRFHAMQRRGYELQYDNERLIASLREQTDKAMQAVTVKNSLLANAAHDLRQPVHALAFYADWLRNEPDMAAEVVPKILLATDSVNTLFNSLFDFAKIEAGAVQPQFSAVPVCQLVSDMKIQFSPAALDRHIEFRERIVPGYVWTDPVLIRRIVGNLVANAIRYTDKGGVLVTTRLRRGYMWIEVWDTGIGIALEHQSEVFREFYKATRHQGTEEGFGLGLAIVQRLASVLGHQVTLCSVPGRGTCMRVELALASPPQRAAV
jgi:signal transduction histidine kinase